MAANLIADSLTKTFGSITAIDHLSFTANPGEIFGLLGPNGAGKTTTIRTVATLIAPTSGTATINDFDIHSHPTDVRRSIGVLTTDIGLYERFSGRENLTYFGQLYGLDKQYLDQRINSLATLLEMTGYLDRKAGTYSTGMKQKLAVARAIIHDPSVMVLDEPTTGLDVLASQTILNFMKHAKKSGKCVVFSTHNMLDADTLCDRLAIIHQGKIVTIDTPDNLKKKTKTNNLADAFLISIGQPRQKEPHELA